MQEGALTDPRGADHGDHLSRVDVEVDSPQYFDRLTAEAEVLDQPANLEQRGVASLSHYNLIPSTGFNITVALSGSTVATAAVARANPATVANSIGSIATGSRSM